MCARPRYDPGGGRGRASGSGAGPRRSNADPLGNIPPQLIEGNGPFRGDPNRVRSAVIPMRFARVPSRHQLAGPGRPRCPSGPAAGVRAVADGQPEADIAAVSGAAATAPRPGRRPVGPGRPRRHGRWRPGEPGLRRCPRPASWGRRRGGSPRGRPAVPGPLPNTRLDADGAAWWRGARGRAIILVAAATAPRTSVRGPAGQTQIRWAAPPVLPSARRSRPSPPFASGRGR